MEDEQLTWGKQDSFKYLLISKVVFTLYLEIVFHLWGNKTDFNYCVMGKAVNYESHYLTRSL